MWDGEKGFLAKVRQEELLREAVELRVLDALSPRRGPDPVALARRVLARWHAAAVNLRETRPIRRCATAWLGQR